jgi:hypothetical protein
MATNVYDARFALPPDPPFPAGRGRFRVKGWACVDELAFYRERLAPAQFEQALEALPGDDFRRYVTQRFSRLGWYDVVPMLYLLSAVASVRKVLITAQVKEVGEWHADRAFAGLSGIVLRALDVSTLCLWLPRMAKTAHDFGDLTTTRADEGCVRGLRSGVPQFLVHNVATVSTAFTERMLARRGADNPRVFFLSPEPDGEAFGQPTFGVAFEIRWGASSLLLKPEA